MKRPGSTPWLGRCAALTLTALVCLVGAGTATSAGDAFTGAWKATDPSDGSSLRLQIGGPSAFGTRSVAFSDGFASACGAPATAIGTGTVSGSTLTATVVIRCGGELLAEGTITYELVGDVLKDGISVFRRDGDDGFRGVWTARDESDGSTLRLRIGAPSPAGVRQVTLTDDHASACGGPAVVIGTGTVSGSTLTAVVDVYCAGELLGEGVAITYGRSGDTLTDGFNTFTRTAP